MALLYALSPYALFPARFSRSAYSLRFSVVRAATVASSMVGSSSSVSTVAALEGSFSWDSVSDLDGSFCSSAAFLSASFLFLRSFFERRGASGCD